MNINETNKNYILWFKKRPKSQDILNKLINKNIINNDNYNVFIFTKYDIYDAKYWKIKTLDLINIEKIRN